MSEDPVVHTGGCLCGAVRYRAEGAPKRVSNCHCRTCQKANGAAFVTAAAFAPENFAFTKGAPKTYASSAQASRSFCPECGTRLAFHYGDGEAVSVWVTTLDDPEAFAPQRHIWVSSKLSWVRVDDGLPAFPQGGSRQTISD